LKLKYWQQRRPNYTFQGRWEKIRKKIKVRRQQTEPPTETRTAPTKRGDGDASNNMIKGYFWILGDIAHTPRFSKGITLISTKIHNPHFNFSNTFKFIYGDHYLLYTSYLLLFLPFIHFFSSWISITHQGLITFDHMFMRGFISTNIAYTWRLLLLFSLYPYWLPWYVLMLHEIDPGT
jgi:hypothetical protein